MTTKINWFGLAGGISTLCLIAVSIFVPWWVLTVGGGIVKANVSPIYADFNFVGNAFTVPLIFAINIASILTMLAGGVAMLVYSVKPEKTYSKRLLSFGYAKPLIIVAIFIIILIALPILVGAVANISVPILGSEITTLPQTATQGTIVTVLMTAELQWPFGLALAAAILCVGARLYHKRMITSPPMSAVTVGKTESAY
jgi:hypothetical protein